VDHLARKLAQKGHEVHIFAHQWPDPGILGEGRVLIHPVPMIRGQGLLELLSFNRGAKKALAGASYDVVQSFEKTTCQDLYRAGEGCHREWLNVRKRYEPWIKTLGVKVNPFHWATLLLEKKLFLDKNTLFFIANSERGKKEIIFHYPRVATRVRVIYNAAEPAVLSPNTDWAGRNGATRRRNLLFLGSGFRRKGLYFLLEALSRLTSKDSWHLTVAGSGDRHRAVKAARNLGVEKSVTFTGPVAKPFPYYQKADLFVLPSLYEPFSNACLEAMACGLPVVTTQQNGASEGIVPGANGQVVKDPADPRALAEAIREALSLDRETVRATNREVLKRHTWDRHLEDLISLYREIGDLKEGKGNHGIQSL
jgi:UDP-glucose:(heptosyl)LPS alpha-1,3-glucosyltransferase